MHISAIVCASKIDGYIFVNGFSMGPCSKDNSISIPWDGHTPLLVSFTPTGGNYLPTALTFSTLDSLPVCDNIILTTWTGVVEVTFNPKKSVAYPPPLLPDELKEVDFRYDGIGYRASLIDYCGVWLILENDESTILCEYLLDKYEKYDLNLKYDNPLLLHIEIDDMHWTIQHEEQSFTLNKIGRYDCKDLGNMLCFTSNEDYAPFSVDFQNENNELKINKYIKSHDYKNQEDIAIDMLSSMMIGDVDYAYSLLSTGLQRAFTPQQVVDYLGSIDSIGKAKYQRQSQGTAIAVFSKSSENTYNAQSFLFEFDTMNKIKNIIPL